MKKYLGASIIINLIIAVLLIGVLTYFIINRDGSNTFSGFSFYKNNVVVLDETIESNNIKDIDLNFSSGKVEILKSDNDQIRIIETSSRQLSDEEKIDYKIENNKLIIQGKKNIHIMFFNIGNNSNTLTLYLPNKEYNNISADVSSGTIKAQDLKAKELSLICSSGVIKLNNAISDKISVMANSGMVDINNIKATTLYAQISSGILKINGEILNVDMRVESGTAKLYNSILPKTLNASAHSGTLSIRLPENEGFEVNTQVGSGTFKSEFELNYNKYKNGGNTYYIKVNSGTAKIIK